MRYPNEFCEEIHKISGTSTHQIKRVYKTFFLYFNKKRFTCWNTLSKFNPDDKLLQNLSGVGFGYNAGNTRGMYLFMHLIACSYNLITRVCKY